MQCSSLDGRQRAGRVVELGSCGHDLVESRAFSIRDDRGLNLSCGVNRPSSAVARERANALSIPLDGDVDVEVLLSQEDVANRSADEIHTVGPVAESCDRLDDRPQDFECMELGAHVPVVRRRCRLDPFQLTEQIGTADDTDELVPAQDGNPTIFGGRDPSLQLGKRRILRDRRKATAHDPAHGSVSQLVSDRLVQVLPAHPTDDPSCLDDEDAALAGAATERHRVADRVVWAYRARRCRHDVSCPTRLALCVSECFEHDGARVVQAQARDRRRRLRVAASPESCCKYRGIDPVSPAAGDDEHTTVHLH